MDVFSAHVLFFFSPPAFATPFEYFEDHDQLSYDLDTEQSKAKYDTRLLSEQMLKLEKSTERYGSADSHANGIGNSAANSELDDDTESETDADVDDLQPHERAASCHNNGHKFTHGQKVSHVGVQKSKPVPRHAQAGFVKHSANGPIGII